MLIEATPTSQDLAIETHPNFENQEKLIFNMFIINLLVQCPCPWTPLACCVLDLYTVLTLLEYLETLPLFLTLLYLGKGSISREKQR